ncbi:phosphoribosyltransferase [Phenylobacterium sp. LjRoot219]|uniref:phosphoribosyltransferase n=1 Tax=Phenylobacterium sp. LjRoot219 TaxID=3342283 RepID=UPI003ECD152D
MNVRPPIFADRRDAGRKLADALRDYVDQDPVVLALPRGGVPVAYEIAVELVAPLDLLFVRKIGAPGHPELGIGAIVDGADPQVVMNADGGELIEPPPSYIAEQVRRELQEIERRREAYLGGREPIDVHGRTVLLVDDGAATGGTLRAAMQGLEKAEVGRLVAALPVGPSEVILKLAEDADEMVCLCTPTPFRAVGLWYRDFRQTSDEEVVELLARAGPAAPEDRGAGLVGADRRP